MGDVDGYQEAQGSGSGRAARLRSTEPAAVDRLDLVRPLVDEVERTRLIDLLAQRWTRRAVVIVAPGGYGKSTAVAQAIRDNDADPSGVDHYIRCRSTQDGDELVRLLWRTFELGDEPPAPGAAAAERVADAIAAQAPVDVAVHLDDLQNAAGHSQSVDLLAHLLRVLPTNGHLVLVGRRLPPLPLARFRAADEVLAVGVGELGFTDAETCVLAEHHGVAHFEFERTAGWPAMTRLALAVGGESTVEYLLDEVVERLDGTERRALAAVVLSGGLDQSTLEACGVDLDLAHLLDRVPLLAEVDDGIVAHDLWGEVVDRLVERDTYRELAGVLVETLSASGRRDRAITLAVDAELWDLARRIAFKAVAAGDSRINVELLDRWLDGFPADQRDLPELRYVRGSAARLGGSPGDGDEDIAAAYDGFLAAGDDDRAFACATEHAMRAWMRNDQATVIDLMSAAYDRGWDQEEPMRSIMRMGEAAVAELGGDFATSLAITELVDPEVLTPSTREVNLRHQSSLSFLLGDAERALAYAERLVDLPPSSLNDSVLAITRWQAGDPDDVIEAWGERRYPNRGNSRDDFLGSVYTAMIDVSLGRRPEVDRVRSLAWDRSREQCFLALVEAASHIAEGDEDRAAELLGSRVAELGIDDPLVLGELRRFVAYSYVLCPAVRDHLDDPGRGPWTAGRRDLAKALLALRSGRRPDPDHIGTAASLITTLPLPWTLELVCRLTEHDRSRALRLAEDVGELVGRPAQEGLRDLIDRAEAPVASGAETIVSALPIVPVQPTTIGCTGPLSLRHGEGEPQVPKRRRVRELLALLILRPWVSRDQAASTIWADMPAPKARNNLNITLRHLENELEPSRRAGEATFHLRREADRLRLHTSEMLNVELHQMLDHADEAQRLEQAGRFDEAAVHHRAVAEKWTEPVLEDLRGIEGAAGDLAAIDTRIAGSTVRAAEWSISQGRYAEATEMAQRLGAHDPYDERAHAVAIGAALGKGDLRGAAVALETCHVALDDLGVEPSSAIRMLERRLETRSGRRASAAG